MRQIIFPLAVIALATAAVTSCGDRQQISESQHISDIQSFDVNTVIKQAKKYYYAAAGGDTVYVVLDASVQWPERFGNANITPLKDTLLQYAFVAKPGTSVDKAITEFVTDHSLMDDSAVVQSIDSLPVTVTDPYFATVNAQIVEMSPRLVTYNVTSSAYVGGAHPNQTSRPFTYDVEGARVLTSKNMFLPGTEKEVLSVVRGSLARQLGVSAEHLENAGIFVAQLTSIPQPYIAKNVVVFHFNPYEIAPYAMGSIDVAVYPYEIDAYLTPATKALFRE